MKLTDEYADWIRDAIAIVRIVQRHGIDEGLADEAMSELEPIIEPSSKEAIAGIVGVLAAMAAQKYEDEELHAMALRVLGLRSNG